MAGSYGFDTVYAHAAPRLVSQLLLSFGDVEDARDCVQEAFARAWLRWDDLTGDGDDPVGWVRTTAWRLAISGWRRRARYLRALRRIGASADLPGPSADVLAVRDCLAALPYGQRAALVLFYYEGLGVEEIAALLGVASGTVKARLSRGRAALLPLLNGHGDGENDV